jgi:hypothetical protein
VIACGTSLSGLNADSIAEIAAKNPLKTLVIINNQETRLHCKSQINIFCDINDAFVGIARKLKAPIPKNPEIKEPAQFVKISMHNPKSKKK